VKHTLKCYLNELEARLHLLTETQTAEIISEYRGHLAAEIAAGTPEREVLRKFGKPAKVAHQFYATYRVYERFRKWQHLALLWLVIYLVGFNEYAFGSSSVVTGGSPRVSSLVWSISWLIIGPLAYWLLSHRCRSQRAFPLVIAWVCLTAGFSHTQAKLTQFSFDYTRSEFAVLPRSTYEAKELSKAAAPLNQLAKSSLQMSVPRNFGRKLGELQPVILEQSQFLNFRVGQRGEYLIPVGRRGVTSNFLGEQPIRSLEFGFTDGNSAALSAWKSFAPDAMGLASRIQPSVVEYSCGLKSFTPWVLMSKWTTWLYSGTYFLYVAGVGILFTYFQLPSILSRRRLA
jgi:hypothetical protein